MDFPSRPKGLEQDSPLLFPGGWAKSEYQSGPIQSSELSIGAGDRWHYRRSAAKAGAGRVDRKRSARSRPTYDRSNRLAIFSGNQAGAAPALTRTTGPVRAERQQIAKM